MYFQLQRNKNATKPSIDEQLQKEKILKGVDTNKQQQHSRLMDEFKKVHRKMFKTSDNEHNDTSSRETEKKSSTRNELAVSSF